MGHAQNVELQFMVLGEVVLHLLEERLGQRFGHKEVQGDGVPGFHEDGALSLEVVLKVLEEVFAHLINGILLVALEGFTE